MHWQSVEFWQVYQPLSITALNFKFILNVVSCSSLSQQSLTLSLEARRAPKLAQNLDDEFILLFSRKLNDISSICSILRHYSSSDCYAKFARRIVQSLDSLKSAERPITTNFADCFARGLYRVSVKG